MEDDSTILMSPGTGEPRWRIPVGSRSLIPPLAAPVALALQQKLRTGERLEVPVFDPVTLTGGIISLAVMDDSVFLVPDSAEFDSLGGLWVPVHSDTLRAWKIAWNNGHQLATMWVDSRGLLLRGISPDGLELDRSAFEITTINYRRRRGSQSAERVGGVVPRSSVAGRVAPAADVTSMRLLIGSDGRPWSLRGDADSAAPQYMEGDTVVTGLALLDSAPGRYDPSAGNALATWLADEPLLGIGDSTIVNRARAIVGDERDPAKATAKLVDWVSRNITRVPHSVVPRAATVLRKRQGDVDGHTLLFVALARAAGVPTRPVSGILFAGDKFHLHSWAEVYLGRWIPVDPTWGGVPAAADRIRFSTGALSRPLDLLPLVAGLDVHLLTLTRRP